MPARRREIGQPFQGALEHQLRTPGTEALRIQRQIPVLGIEQRGRAQLDQTHAPFESQPHPAQQLIGRQPVRRDQILLRQARRRHDGTIGRREFVCRQILRTHPGQGLAFGTVGLAVEGGHFPDIQQHLLVRIIVVDADQRPGGTNLDAQLLLQLTAERRLGRLAGLDLAAGEFPQPTLVLVQRAPGDQHPAIAAANHRGGHCNACHVQIVSVSCSAARYQRWKAGH